MRALTGALALDESQLAVREGVVFAPRLARAGAGVLAAPEGVSEWRLRAGVGGTPEGLSLVPGPEAGEPLEPGRFVSACVLGALNFRDVLIMLWACIRGEASRWRGRGGCVGGRRGGGGSGCRDRVMGLFSGFGPVSVTDCRLLARVPEGWSFAQAASVPIVFLTAYYAADGSGRAAAG